MTEETQVNNLVEHLRVTKESLQIVNEELSTSLAQKAKAEETTNKLRSEIEELSSEVVSINRRIKESEDRETEAINSLKEEKETLVSEIDSLSKEIRLQSRKIPEQLNLIQKNSEEISRLESIKIELLDEIESSIFKKETVINKIEELQNTKRNLEEEILEIKKDKQSEKLKFEKLTEEYNKFVEENNKLIDIEKEKILGPMALLEETRLAIEKKEKNLLILTTRFRNKFETTFPGQKVII